MQNVEDSQSQEKSNLIEFSFSPLQDSMINVEQKEESVQNVSSNKSPPPPQNNASLDSEQSIESPPITSGHTSLDESHSTVGEKGERESGDENSVSEQEIAEESPPPKSISNHSLTLDGSTTPEPSPSSQQPTLEELVTQNTPSTAKSSQAQDTSQSLQSNTSVASSSRKVAFSIKEGVAPSTVPSQLGLFSPGSLHQTGLSFQTPPSGSYQLMSELPPTPFQDANFDLDTSSESEHEEEEQQQLSHESGNSFDSSYFRRLQERVVPLLSQEDFEASSNHKLEDVVSRTEMEEPQAKLVDIDQSSSCPTDSQPPISRHHGVLDSANSLKVDDLLGLDSSGTSQLLQQSPLLKAYQSPQVGQLVDIRTPGSKLSGKPLLTSTVQGHQMSTMSQEHRGQVLSPSSDILLPYLPSHSGSQIGALISGVLSTVNVHGHHS